MRLLSSCSTTLRRAGSLLLVGLSLYMFNAPALQAQQRSPKAQTRTIEEPHQWFIWAEELKRGRALLPVNERSPNRWLWRLPKETSQELELCIFSQSAYDIHNLEPVAMAWPEAENYQISSKQALLCAQPDKEGIIELKVEPFEPARSALGANHTKKKKTKPRRKPLTTSARVLTRLGEAELMALLEDLPKLKIERPQPGSTDQWWLIEAPPAQELKGALFLLDVTLEQDAPALPVEIGEYYGRGRTFVVVSSAPFRLEGGARHAKGATAPTAWSSAEQLKVHDKAWMFGELKDGIALWSAHQGSDSMLKLARQPEPVRSLKKLAADEDALFIGAREPELYSSGSGFDSVLKPKPPAQDQASKPTSSLSSCSSGVMAAPMTLWGLMFWLFGCYGARRRQTMALKLVWIVAGLALTAGLVPPEAMAKDKPKLCDVRARVFWDGLSHQQQRHWRALCARDESSLPEDYQIVIALPPAGLDLSVPPKKDAQKQRLLRRINADPSNAWELELEQRIGKGQITREYVMVGYKIYHSAYHVDACVLAKNKHAASLASEFEAIGPLCKKGWMVFVAYLRLKPKEATQTRRRATRGEQPTYEGTIAYMPEIRFDWQGAQSISVDPGITPTEDIVGRQEIKAPWPMTPSLLGSCYVHKGTRLEPHITSEVSAKETKSPRVRSRFMFEQVSELAYDERCSRDKLALKLAAP